MSIKFKLESSLQKAKMKLSGKKGELLQITKPFYRDELHFTRNNAKYTILRSGTILRKMKIYKNKELYGTINEKLGLMTKFEVNKGKKIIFTINEIDTIITQNFQILEGKKIIGQIQPIGAYVPVLSNIGKGLQGEIEETKEEDLLISAIIALGA